ncbi:MAG TPA: hypothetical protein VIL48_17220 [Acidimicrobiales bacterium]
MMRTAEDGTAETGGSSASGAPGGASASGASGGANGAAGPAGPSGRSGFTDEVRDVVGAAVGAITRAGTITAANVADAAEGAARALTRRVVTTALDAPRPLRDRHELARALAERPSTPVLASATSAAFMARTVSRFRALSFLARKTPMWIVAGLVPALVVSVTRGADELGMISSHLAHRAREAGVEPDPERLRRAAVQVAAGVPVDPDAEPRHGGLVVLWLKRAGRAALPFTSGIRTKDPEGLAAAAAEVDPQILAAP